VICGINDYYYYYYELLKRKFKAYIPRWLAESLKGKENAVIHFLKYMTLKMFMSREQRSGKFPALKLRKMKVKLSLCLTN
jgi:hypothetical protein